VQQSVQSSGLLPQKLLINDRAKSIDISGLSQIEGQLSPIPLPVWKNVGLDSMSLVREHVTFSRTQNLPMYEDNEVTAEDHLQHLYSGFQSACRVIAQNKSSFRNLFQNTAECRGRVVLRPTYLYEHILEESLHPHLLGDALAREQYFNQLWIQHQDSKLKSIYVAEHGDLWVGDIPFFFTMPKCRSIFTSAGSEIGDFFAQSGMDAALQRLDMMSNEYSKGQLWFLDISFNGKESTASSRRLHVEQNDSASLLDEAVRIGNKIVSDAFVDEEMAAWVTVREVRDGNYEPIVSGIDLYSGISGISLFLTYLWKATADRNFYDFAVASIKCLCSLIRDGEFQDAPLTLGDGLGGLLYLSIHSNDVLKDSHSFELMNYCLERLYSKDFESHDVDILSGSAGIALSSLSCFKATGNPIALDIALKNGRNLLKNLADLSITSDLLTARSLERGSWSGFGHGLFGVIAAVSEISKFVSDQQYKAESDKLITRFSKIALTLPGMRDSASWCRGYTGSLIALLTILDPDTLDKRTRMLIKSSLNKYVESRILPSDCACHGELGNLELLLHPNTRKVADFSVDSAVSSRLRMVKDRAVRLGWHCGSQAENPSLFEGLSGIGYQLLRLQDPVITPSFLRFEGPPSPPK
jgi:type 2 lantibiotic biosynthesis protein LanM